MWNGGFPLFLLCFFNIEKSLSGKWGVLRGVVGVFSVFCFWFWKSFFVVGCVVGVVCVVCLVLGC